MGLLSESPDDAFTLFAIAKEYEKAKNSEKALQYYLLLKEKHPDYVGLYYHLGKLFESLKQSSEALSIYATGIEVARSQRDNHALAELNSAKMELEMDLE